MNIQDEEVQPVEAVGSGASHSKSWQWYKKERSADNQESEHQEKPDQPLRLNVADLLTTQGAIKINGTVIIEGVQKNSQERYLSRISPETSFYFHTHQEMERTVKPSNQNKPFDDRIRFSEAFKSYNYPALALAANNTTSNISAI